MFQWFLDLIRFLRFSRTVTTLPFAFGAYVMATNGGGSLDTLIPMVVCLVLGVLSFLFFNRAYNYETEFRVPRDRERERLFSGLDFRWSFRLTCLFVILFFLTCYRLNLQAFYLSPIVFALMFSYVPSRYYTAFNHLLLGATASLFIFGPYTAVRGDLNVEAVVGGLAVMFWITGYDIIYSLHNVEKDRAQGYRSFPSDYGTQISLYTSRGCHLISMFCFFAYAVFADLGNFYLSGIGFFCILMTYAHLTANQRGHLDLVNLFFNLNALLSIGFFTLSLLEQLSKA